MNLTQQRLIDDYQGLLRADEETVSTVKRASALVQSVFGGRVRATTSGLEYEPVGPDGPDRSQLRENMAVFGNGFAQRQLRQVLEHVPRRDEALALRSLAIDCSMGLAVIPAIAAEPSAKLDDKRYALLFDSCILLAHHVYFGLLPRLGGPAFEAERALLLSALNRFADLTPVPADRYTVLALYFEALGQFRRAGDAYRQALAATHADSHEFMTGLQTYWTFLIERGLHDEALDVLLETYPRVPRRDLEELNELIRQTFKQRVTRRRRKISRRKRP